MDSKSTCAYKGMLPSTFEPDFLTVLWQLDPIFHPDTSFAASKSPPEPSPLLPPAQISPAKDTQGQADERLQDGLSIERPRSALHSGDFTNGGRTESSRPDDLDRRRTANRIAAEASWTATSPPRDYQLFNYERRIPIPETSSSFRSGSPYPLSASFSSTFVYQPPTSPLVQSEINEDLDFPIQLDGMILSSSRLGSRRQTLHSASSSPFASPSSRAFMPPRAPLHRREGSLPYQAHQPRRSLTSTPNFSYGTSPQTPLSRSRRPSFGSDSSPIQHASMVGSYEESILRGRMSTTPSKPLEFVVQIGVLGKGKCKPRLRCPSHVTLSFPAVYYSYNTTVPGRSVSEDGPSPYVGQVDLENGLPNVEEESRLRKKAQSRYAERVSAGQNDDLLMPDADLGMERQQTLKPKRRSGSPKAPPGGSYRIPEKGQIQLLIKNPNKTALKLFLVPYDLTGMEPGTKTFIRQRSYSNGPIIDNAPQAPGQESAERPVLRYLVHLHICCPAKGRFYLYKSIRIVFANRVPDDKEKLRNETTLPEPRFSPYKPIRVMHPPLSTSGGPGAMLAADKAFRRRSLGVSVVPSSQAFDMADGMYPPGLPLSTGAFGGNTLPLEPIPFRLPTRDGRSSDLSDSNTISTTAAGLRSPAASSQASGPPLDDAISTLSPWQPGRYEKLNKGDFGYGGVTFGGDLTRGLGGAESLLSQRLRSLGVKTASAPGLVEEGGDGRGSSSGDNL